MSVKELAEEAWQGRLGPYEAMNMRQGVVGEVIAKGVFHMKSFANVTGVETKDGIILIDTGSGFYQAQLFQTLRKWSNKPVTHAVYTHRHVDHTGGIKIFDHENKLRHRPAVQVIGHKKVREGFDRYKLMGGYNALINQKQFGLPAMPFTRSFHYPDIEYEDELKLMIGGVAIECYHARGETDDATWVYLPGEGVVFTGDFAIWAFPNCGNPQKVQRYPVEWAAALRRMASKKPKIVVPGHGLPVFGEDRCNEFLTNSAAALEYLVEHTLAMINKLVPLNEIIHTIKLPAAMMNKPYLQAVYDEPQFIINNLWRDYAGWYDQNPSHLKPPRDKDLASEVVSLCGCEKLVARAEKLFEENKLELSSSLIEMAHHAHSDDEKINDLRAKIYLHRSKTETSLMAKNIFKAVHRDVHGRDDDDDDVIRFLAVHMQETDSFIKSML